MENYTDKTRNLWKSIGKILKGPEKDGETRIEQAVNLMRAVMMMMMMKKKKETKKKKTAYHLIRS